MLPTLISATLLAFPALIAAQEPAYLSPVLVQPALSAKKCIQPQGGASTDGTPIVLADCTGATAQEFFFSANQIRVFSNKCITVPGGSTTDGVQLTITTCASGNANQNWSYDKFRKTITWVGKGKCIDLNSGSLTNGNKVQSWACSSGNINQVFDVGYMANNLPAQSENGQSGTNKCGTNSTQSSMCQTAWINDVDDFCLWAPPSVGSIGDTEREEVAWCTKSGRGTRVIPNGTLKGVHFVRTPDYVQVTGVGDFTKINVKARDAGGELDPHGADGNGNPIGGLVFGNTFGNALQYHEWTSFISDTEFCFRACINKDAAKLCNHIYDVLGCFWNMPANYDSGTFESCDGEDDLPMGVYGTSTFHQGQASTPPAHPAAPSSDCRKIATVSSGPASSTPPPTTTTTPPVSTSTGSPAPTGHVIHTQLNANKCLNAVSNVAGAKVTIQDCNGSANQGWVRNGNTFRVFGDKCLDVIDGVNADGTKLQIWTCGSGTNANQQFTTNSFNQIQWVGKGKCLDLTDGSTTNGQQMQVWTCAANAGNKNQVWNII